MEGRAEQRQEVALAQEGEGHQAQERPVQEPSRRLALDATLGEAWDRALTKRPGQVEELDGGAQALP